MLCSATGAQSDAVTHLDARLPVRRIVRAAFNAVDHQIVDLTVLCMQQNGAAISAGIINRVIAGFENRGGVENGASCRRGDDLQADSAVRRHGLLP
jgi:succinylarginine dihydrolase